MFRGALVVVPCVLLLQACGGGGGGEESGSTANAESPSPEAGQNHAPTISGSPPTSVHAGQFYSFTPSASDADGDALRFSIINKPAWATFDAATGRLTGTPAAVETIAGVVISVSDGKTSSSLEPYTLTVSAAPASTTGSARVSWTPPTRLSDGSTLTNLAGYKIYYGASPDNFDETITLSNPGLSSYVVDGLTTGTYFFVVTAFDATGAESGPSNIVSKTIS